MVYIGLRQNILYYLGLSKVKRLGSVEQNTVDKVLEAIDFVFNKDNFKGPAPKIHISNGPIILKSGYLQRASYNPKKKIIQISEGELRKYAEKSGYCFNLECPVHNKTSLFVLYVADLSHINPLVFI